MEIGGAAALIQGGFYFLTGIWPMISIGTFQKILHGYMVRLEQVHEGLMIGFGPFVAISWRGAQLRRGRRMNS